LVEEVNKCATRVGSVQLPKRPGLFTTGTQRGGIERGVPQTRILGLMARYSFFSCSGRWKRMASWRGINLRHAGGVSVGHKAQGPRCSVAVKGAYYTRDRTGWEEARNTGHSHDHPANCEKARPCVVKTPLPVDFVLM